MRQHPAPIGRIAVRLGLWDADVARTEGRVLIAGYCLAATGWLLALVYMSSVALSGDEVFHNDRARMLADLLTGRGGSVRGVQEAMVDHGWFMPGMSLLLVPLHVLLPEPAVPAIRTYVAAIYVLLWIWTLREFSTAFDRRWRIALVIFPTLAATWLLFGTTLWGELPAGLLLAITAVRAHRLAMTLLRDQPLPFRDLILLELIMVAMVYVRGTAIIAVAATNVFLAALAVISRHWVRLVPRVAQLLAGLALFAACLAPWSLTASRLLGGPVVTTSSAMMSFAITFGDSDQLCFGACGGTNIWLTSVRYSRGYAQQHGISQLQAQRAMAENALRDVTFSEYTRQVRANVAAFVAPNGLGPRRGQPFLERFAERSTTGISPAGLRTLNAVARAGTITVYVPFFAALVIANAFVFVRSRRFQIMSLCLKALTMSLFLQPFST